MGRTRKALIARLAITVLCQKTVELYLRKRHWNLYGRSVSVSFETKPASGYLSTWSDPANEYCRNIALMKWNEHNWYLQTWNFNAIAQWDWMNTEQRWLVPVSVAHFQEILLAVVAFEDVEFGDVEHDAFAVGGRDAPLAALTFFGDGRHLERRRWERGLVVLKRPPASCRHFNRIQFNTCSIHIVF